MRLPIRGTIIQTLKDYNIKYCPELMPQEVIDKLCSMLPPATKEEYKDLKDYELAWICLQYLQGVDDTSLQANLDYITETILNNFGSQGTFKGGYILTKLLHNTARRTTDVDFSIADKNLYTDIKEVLHSIGKHFLDTGVASDYTVKEDIAETCCGGLDIIGLNGKKLFGCDVGLHDTSWGTTQYDLNVGCVKAFTVERMLSDKTKAILSKKRFRRPKDIYDFKIITDVFDVDVPLLSTYMNLQDVIYPLTSDILVQYKKAYDLLTVQSPYPNINLVKPTFTECLERFYKIVDNIYYHFENNYWDHVRQEVILK